MKKIDSLLNQVEELQLVQYRIRAEGLHYCFKHYSSFEEIGDEKFHELRKKYLTISDELECWTISDRGTALYRQENTNLNIHDLQETILVNPYSILLLDNEHNSSTSALRDFLLSSASEIDNYKVNNETLFYSGQPNV